MKLTRCVLASAAVVALCVASAAQASGVVNGDFEAGNTGFMSDYGYIAAAGHDTLAGSGSYAVGANPFDYHGSWGSFGDHTSGFGNMMIVNGGTGATPGPYVWHQDSVAVTFDTDYYLSAWVASTSEVSPAQLRFLVNGRDIGVLNASTTVGLWTQFVGVFHTPTSFANLEILDNNLNGSGNDFAIDDISFGTSAPGGVPEPATWAMMLVGFGGLGAVLRRRRVALAA